tara:strand:- start:386 stop:1009 length:624 start_codon:yes stop_codon:yes gene_type:complete
MTKTFLHLGCGPQYKNGTTPEFMRDDWDEVRLDIDETVKPDIIASMTDMSVVESNSFDAIYSSHNIEHLFAHEVPIALKEMHRVLKDDGFLVITCPDIQVVAEFIAKGQLTEKLYDSGMGPISPIDILYGHRDSIKQGNHYMAHKVGFTAGVLNSTLIGVGFKSSAVARQIKHYNLWGISYKNIQLERNELAEELSKHANLEFLADE